MNESLTCLECGNPVAFALGHDPYCPHCDDADERRCKVPALRFTCSVAFRIEFINTTPAASDIAEDIEEMVRAGFPSAIGVKALVAVQ